MKCKFVCSVNALFYIEGKIQPNLSKRSFFLLWYVRPGFLGNAKIYFIDWVVFNLFKKKKKPQAIKQKPTSLYKFHPSPFLRANHLVKHYYYNLASGFPLKIRHLWLNS